MEQKELKFKVVAEDSNVCVLQVEKQTHRGLDFGDNSNSFYYNRVRFASASYPEYRPDYVSHVVLCVMGEEKKKDDHCIIIPIGLKDEVFEAQDEYNRVFGKKENNVLELKELWKDDKYTLFRIVKQSHVCKDDSCDLPRCLLYNQDNKNSIYLSWFPFYDCRDKELHIQGFTEKYNDLPFIVPNEHVPELMKMIAGYRKFKQE